MDLLRFPTLRVVRKEDDPAFVKANFAPPSVPEELLPGTPPSFSLRDRMTSARNQGSAGTCTSFACIGALEYFFKPSGTGGDIDLSEAEATHRSEQAHGDCTEGLATAHCMSSLKSHGVVLEEKWRYDQTQICWANPPNCAAEQHYKFAAVQLAFQRPRAAILQDMAEQAGEKTTIHGTGLKTRSGSGPIPGNFVPIIKNLVANGRVPVVVGVPVWWASDGHFDAGWESGPDVQMPTPVQLQNFLHAQKGTKTTPPNVSGWHAITICGYDDSRARLVFKNSWGWWWGDSGFGTIPYDYIKNYADVGYFGQV